MGRQEMRQRFRAFVVVACHVVLRVFEKWGDDDIFTPRTTRVELQWPFCWADQARAEPATLKIKHVVELFHLLHVALRDPCSTPLADALSSASLALCRTPEAAEGIYGTERAAIVELLRACGKAGKVWPGCAPTTALPCSDELLLFRRVLEVLYTRGERGRAVIQELVRVMLWHAKPKALSGRTLLLPPSSHLAHNDDSERGTADSAIIGDGSFEGRLHGSVDCETPSAWANARLSFPDMDVPGAADLLSFVSRTPSPPSATGGARYDSPDEDANLSPLGRHIWAEAGEGDASVDEFFHDSSDAASARGNSSDDDSSENGVLLGWSDDESDDSVSIGSGYGWVDETEDFDPDHEDFGESSRGEAQLEPTADDDNQVDSRNVGMSVDMRHPSPGLSSTAAAAVGSRVAPAPHVEQRLVTVKAPASQVAEILRVVNANFAGTSLDRLTDFLSALEPQRTAEGIHGCCVGGVQAVTELLRFTYSAAMTSMIDSRPPEPILIHVDVKVVLQWLLHSLRKAPDVDAIAQSQGRTVRSAPACACAPRPALMPTLARPTSKRNGQLSSGSPRASEQSSVSAASARARPPARALRRARITSPSSRRSEAVGRDRSRSRSSAGRHVNRTGDAIFGQPVPLPFIGSSRQSAPGQLFLSELPPTPPSASSGGGRPRVLLGQEPLWSLLRVGTGRVGTDDSSAMSAAQEDERGWQASLRGRRRSPPNSPRGRPSRSRPAPPLRDASSRSPAASVPALALPGHGSLLEAGVPSHSSSTRASHDYSRGGDLQVEAAAAQNVNERILPASLNRGGAAVSTVNSRQLGFWTPNAVSKTTMEGLTLGPNSCRRTAIAIATRGSFSTQRRALVPCRTPKVKTKIAPDGLTLGKDSVRHVAMAVAMATPHFAFYNATHAAARLEAPSATESPGVARMDATTMSMRL